MYVRDLIVIINEVKIWNIKIFLEINLVVKNVIIICLLVWIKKHVKIVFSTFIHIMTQMVIFQNVKRKKRGFKMLEKIIYFFRIRPRCNCRGFCVLCRFYKKCSYEMGVQKYCERKLRN